MNELALLSNTSERRAVTTGLHVIRQAVHELSAWVRGIEREFARLPDSVRRVLAPERSIGHYGEAVFRRVYVILS
jgi:hypothetical protein